MIRGASFCSGQWDKWLRCLLNLKADTDHQVLPASLSTYRLWDLLDGITPPTLNSPAQGAGLLFPIQPNHFGHSPLYLWPPGCCTSSPLPPLPPLLYPTPSPHRAQVTSMMNSPINFLLRHHSEQSRPSFSFLFVFLSFFLFSLKEKSTKRSIKGQIADNKRQSAQL